MSNDDLDDLRRAREALAASEYRLSLVLRGTNDGWWDWDLVDGSIHYSPRWWTMLGYQPGELPADQDLWRRLTHPDDRLHVERVLADLLAGGPEIAEVEFRLQHKQGHYVPVLSRGYLLRGPDGQPLRLSGANSDLSQRRAAEAALQESETNQQALFAAMGDGVFVAQPYRFVFCNPALPAMLGYAPDGFVGLGFEQVVHPDFLRTWTERFEARIGGGPEPTRHYELRFLKRGGAESIWVELRANRFHYRGAPAVLGIVRDVGERKAAEAALRASEERWKFAIEGAGDGVWDWDMASRDVVYSRRWQEMLGYGEGEIPARIEEWRDRVHLDDAGPARAALREHLEGRLPQFRAEYRMLHRDGRWVPVLARGLVVARSADGQPLRLIGTHTDLTQRKLEEAERVTLEARLRETQKMEAIGTLAGGVAHDFNNVLAGILINARLIRDALGPGHAALESLEQIQSAGARARTLVQQILAFSRRQPQRLVNQAMAPLVEESVALLRTTLPAGVEIEAALGPEPLHVLADATQIQQVLMNLCTNAWHALVDGRGHIFVGLEAAEIEWGRSASRHVHLWVSDDGCGMDAAARERIFEPFFTTKPVGQGTGLGLSVVHGIVQAHGGTIQVQSEPGQGSCFHVLLPRVEPQAAPESAIATVPGALGGGQRVLYIDDDEIMVVTVGRLLERAGYEVVGHRDADAALEVARRAPGVFDLVVTDFNMPGRSGLDVARELAALRPELPVVISSGFISESLRAEAHGCGVRALMRKEHTIEELVPLVRRLLG